MVDIVTPGGLWDTAEDFTDAINKIEKNFECFINGNRFVLIDWETKQTMFLKVRIGVEEY